MQFRIQKNEFLKGLRIAQSIADRKSTMPILANVLLRTVGDEGLQVRATDLNVSLTADLHSTNESEGGITVGAKALYDTVSSLPGSDVEFRRTDNNWVEIRADKVNYRLVGMPDRDFPKIPEVDKVERTSVDAQVLKEMIDQTIFSVSNDETRFHLNGVLFECDGAVSLMVSTDGHRLSKVERKLSGPQLTAGVIIPKKGLLEAKRLLDLVAGDCRLGIKTPYLFLEGGGICLSVKLIDSQFPPYNAVIPTTNDKEIVVDRLLLLDALKRAFLMSSDTRGVRVNVATNSLFVTSTNPDLGEVKEELEASYEGEDTTVGFNPKYVVELLGQIKSDSIQVELGGELDPLVIRPTNDPSYLGVVMPMRI